MHRETKCNGLTSEGIAVLSPEGHAGAGTRSQSRMLICSSTDEVRAGSTSAWSELHSRHLWNVLNKKCGSLARCLVRLGDFVAVFFNSFSISYPSLIYGVREAWC